MDTLPIDVYSILIQFCSVKDWIHALQASKGLHICARNPSIWRHIKHIFRTKRLSKNALRSCGWIKCHRSARDACIYIPNLHINSRMHYSIHLRLLMRCVEHLSSLTLNFRPVAPHNQQSFLELLPKFQKLNHLSLNLRLGHSIHCLLPILPQSVRILTLQNLGTFGPWRDSSVKFLNVQELTLCNTFLYENFTLRYFFPQLRKFRLIERRFDLRMTKYIATDLLNAMQVRSVFPCHLTTLIVIVRLGGFVEIADRFLIVPDCCPNLQTLKIEEEGLFQRPYRLPSMQAHLDFCAQFWKALLVRQETKGVKTLTHLTLKIPYMQFTSESSMLKEFIVLNLQFVEAFMFPLAPRSLHYSTLSTTSGEFAILEGVFDFLNISKANLIRMSRYSQNGDVESLQQWNADFFIQGVHPSDRVRIFSSHSD